jgi:AraC family transcriptional regulator
MAEEKLRCDPTCSTLSAMADRPNPVFRTIEEVSLIGTTATYDSQAEASQGIPRQWRSFRQAHPALESSSKFYGASPCTGDRKIHYLTGVAYEGPDGVVGGERLTLEAGEYAVIHVNDTALLRDTWTWLLGHWLATSGRREKNAPEFERFASISEAGTPIGPVEIWIPLEPLSRD